jgi:hypothetical protein
MLIALAASHLLPYGLPGRVDAQARAADPPPISVNGLEILVRPARPSFATDEPIAMTVTFRNTSTSAFRVPDRTQPPQTAKWVLHVVEKTTGKSFTGVDLRPCGAS